MFHYELLIRIRQYLKIAVALRQFFTQKGKSFIPGFNWCGSVKKLVK